MNLGIIKNKVHQLYETILAWAVSPQFYAQIVAVIIAILIAWFVNSLLKKQVSLFSKEPQPGSFFQLRKQIYQAQYLLLQILCVIFLGMAIQVTLSTVNQTWLVRIAQSLAVVVLLYGFITRYIKHPFINSLCRWIGIPLATLHVFGWLLDDPEKPDCEIREFADSGIVFGVEYWIDGIDDGVNRVEADLLMMIWIALKENNIQIPFPHRDVHIVQGTIKQVGLGLTK